MAAIAAGDQSAFAVLLARFEGQIRRTARRWIADAGEIEDAVQEVALRVWVYAGSYDASRGTLKTWINCIARRHGIDTLRKRTLRSALEQAVELRPEHLCQPAPAPHHHNGEDGDWHDELRAAIAKLPPNLRRIIELRLRGGGMPLRLIAQLEGRPVGTIKSSYSRALRKLRDQLAPPQDERRAGA